MSPHIVHYCGWTNSCTTLKLWETVVRWHLQGNHHSRVSLVVQDFVHPQYSAFVHIYIYEYIHLYIYIYIYYISSYLFMYLFILRVCLSLRMSCCANNFPLLNNLDLLKGSGHERRQPFRALAKREPRREHQKGLKEGFGKLRQGHAQKDRPIWPWAFQKPG